MNSSNAFRSHLMQQLVANARTQTRPPLALVGWLSDDEDSRVQWLSQATVPKTASSRRPASTLSSSRGSVPTNNNPCQAMNSYSSVPSLEAARVSSVRDDTQVGESHPPPQDGLGKPISEDRLARRFQDLLQTRYTSSRFAPLPLPPQQQQELLQDETMYWKQVLDRAALCGRSAPNHRRTEPFTFKRLVAPSPRTERLADIAYQVALRHEHKVGVSPEELEHQASNKRERWTQIPAFLVTVVSSKTMQEDTLSTSDETVNQYDPLPFVPPRTEGELEDYAAACAATQNVLLALHSEHVASKWATGPVIRTPAFRDLVQATPQDRIVAMVMIGHPSGEDQQPRRRRYRREFHGDVLVDL